MMEPTLRFLALKNRPGIQTMATVAFTFHSIFLMAHLLAVVSGEDITMHLRLSSVDVSLQEIRLAVIPRMLLMVVTIVVDLLLIIGIEDNSVLAMKLFAGWTALDIVVDFSVCLSLVVLKSNRLNAVCAGRVYQYARAKQAESVHRLEDDEQLQPLQEEEEPDEEEPAPEGDRRQEGEQCFEDPGPSTSNAGRSLSPDPVTSAFVPIIEELALASGIESPDSGAGRDDK
ncbi:uncharacterized protein LOC144167100 isoform X2 [Haemaphysalis longicornis]